MSMKKGRFLYVGAKIFLPITATVCIGYHVCTDSYGVIAYIINKSTY